MENIINNLTKIIKEIINFYTCNDIMFIIIQLFSLFFLLLIDLYKLINSRKFEVVVLSHPRLIISSFILCSVSLFYYRMILYFAPGENVISYIIYYILIIISFMILTPFQQLVLELINKIKNTPIIKDLKREEYGDCNYSVIRRFSIAVFVWYLFIPGIILNSPFPIIVKAIIVLIWYIYILFSRVTAHNKT